MKFGIGDRVKFIGKPEDYSSEIRSLLIPEKVYSVLHDRPDSYSKNPTTVHLRTVRASYYGYAAVQTKDLQLVESREGKRLEEQSAKLIGKMDREFNDAALSLVHCLQAVKKLPASAQQQLRENLQLYSLKFPEFKVYEQLLPLLNQVKEETYEENY